MEPGIKERVTVTCDSVIRAKDSGYRSKRWCPSGLKTAATVARIGTIGTKDGSYRNMDVSTFIVAVQDITAVCGSHC